MMVGRFLSFWDGNFSGVMLNFGGVSPCKICIVCYPKKVGGKMFAEGDMDLPNLCRFGVPSCLKNRPQMQPKMSHICVNPSMFVCQHKLIAILYRHKTPANYPINP